MHVPDYQATSNSWTFLEVNVGIICACELQHFQLFICQDIHNDDQSPSTLHLPLYQPPTFDQTTYVQVMLTLTNYQASLS